jgi:hypothetical protein
MTRRSPAGSKKKTSKRKGRKDGTTKGKGQKKAKK